MTKRCLLGTAAGLSGTLCGAMSLIGASLVPYCKSIPPKEFHLWFAAHGNFLGNFMIPLTGITTIVAVIALLANSTKKHKARVPAAIAALGVLLIVAVYLIFNAPINEQLMQTAALTDDQIKTLLSQWSGYHWVRVTLGIGAFVASLVAFKSAD